MERVAFSNMVCRCDSSIAKQNCGDFGGGGGRKCQILSIGFNQKESIPVNLFQSAELIPVNRFQSERVDSCQLGWIQFSHSESVQPSCKTSVTTFVNVFIQIIRLAHYFSFRHKHNFATNFRSHPVIQFALLKLWTFSTQSRFSVSGNWNSESRKRRFGVVD